MRHLTEPAQAAFFWHGTTEPVCIFADPECTIPHTHPVWADVGYVFPKIYLAKADRDVDLVVRNQSGDTLYQMRLMCVGVVPYLKMRP